MLGLRKRRAPAKSLCDAIMTAPDQMPPDESAWLAECYAAADVILEYGSGKSTLVGAEMAGKLLFSVESDMAWAENLQAHFADHPPAASVNLHPVDIGKTGKWGNPVDESGWQRYHRYPVSVWDRDDFAHPDVVLIDGRFRMACLITTLLRIERPTTVLFDDYTNRPHYHGVEAFAKPVATRGRMARFELTPGPFPAGDLAKILEMYTRVA